MLPCENRASRSAWQRQHWRRCAEPSGRRQESGFSDVWKTADDPAARRWRLAPPW